jgi:hypothetical protein
MEPKYAFAVRVIDPVLYFAKEVRSCSWMAFGLIFVGMRVEGGALGLR